MIKNRFKLVEDPPGTEGAKESEDRPLCPVRIIGTGLYKPCFGEKCAWWDGVDTRCAVLSIVSSLEGVGRMIDCLDTTLSDVKAILKK